MAGEYDINLSNGTILASLYPLEVNGPSNISTPRQVFRINGGTNEVEISGNITYRFVPTFRFDVSFSGDANGTYEATANSFVRFTYKAPHNNAGRLGGNAASGGLFFLVSSVSTDYYVWFNSDGANNTPALSPDYGAFLAGKTAIEVPVSSGDTLPAIAIAIRDAIDAEADFTATIDPARPDIVRVDIAAGVIEASRSPQPGSATFAIGDVRTVIPVTNVLPTPPLPATPAEPFGQVTYTTDDPRTTISLPGRGTVNWGEYFVDDLVHMLENFAADVEPDLNTDIGDNPFGQPLKGQWWYKTLPGQEGFKYYDGTQWTSNLDIDDGALIFRDLEDGNKDIYLTGSETNLPAPWVGGANNQPGFVIWSQVNPASEEPLFRVLSSGGAEQLRVEHDGRIEADGALYIKNVTSAGDGNIIDGNLGIGGGTFDGAITQTLTVEGNGIAVNSDTGLNAGLALNSPAGLTSYIDFTNGGVLNGNLAVNDTVAGDPLEINSAVANDVVLVTGGGNVGINQVDPSRTLDVVGESEFNGDVYVINSDQIFNDGFGLESVTGALLKTGPGGGTWQTTAASSSVSSLVVNDSTGTPMVDIGETNGMRSDVRVGINQAPPVTNVPLNTDVWLGVNGDIQSSGQFIADAGTAGSPAYTFTTDPSTGLYHSNTAEVAFSSGGVATHFFASDEARLNYPRAITGGTETQPGFAFASNTNTGMFSSTGNELAFTTGGTEALRIAASGLLSVAAVTDYETLLLNDDDIPNKKYVDDRVDNISWREPVVVRSQTLYADNTFFPLTGTVDGVTLSVGDRVLFNDVTAVADRDIWTWSGAIWVRDDDPNTRSVGDAVYVQEGTDFGKVYAFNNEDEWKLISGSGGGTLAQVERQTATPAQTVFTLTNPYKPTVDGNRLLVFVDGVKYIKGIGYTEDTTTQITLLPPTPLVGGEQVEFYVLSETTPTANLKREQQTGLVGTPTITFTLISYVVGSDALLVYLNGQKAIIGIDYTEATPSTINWIGTPLVATDYLEFYNSVPITAGTLLTDIDDVAPTTPSTGDILVYNNVTGLWEPTAGPGIEDGVNFDELVANAGGTQTVFNTVNASVQSKAGGKAFQQVFVNGVLQKEGATFAYTVTGANQITFNAPVVANADVTIYEL